MQTHTSCVQYCGDIWRTRDPFAVAPSEVGRQAVALNAVGEHETIAIESVNCRRRVCQRACNRKVEFAGITIGQRARIILRDLCKRQRPATVRHICSPLEIDRLESYAPTTPKLGCSAEGAPPVFGRIGMRLDRRSAVEVERIVFGLEASRLEQCDLESAAIKFAGEGDTCSPRSYDADIDVLQICRRQIARGNDHCYLYSIRRDCIPR